MAESVAGYCNRCDTEREILITVSWQSNTCKHCGGTDVDTDRSTSTNSDDTG